MFVQEILGQNVVGDDTNGRGGRVVQVDVGVACVSSLVKFRCLLSCISMSFATTRVSVVVFLVVWVGTTIGKMGHVVFG